MDETTGLTGSGAPPQQPPTTPPTAEGGQDPEAPVWYQPADRSIKYKDSGIRVIANVSGGGQYWVTPDGQILLVGEGYGANSHEIFANRWLGGVDRAEKIGMVRVRLGDELYLRGGDMATMSNLTVESIAKEYKGNMITVDISGKGEISFIASVFQGSKSKLYGYVLGAYEAAAERAKRMQNVNPWFRKEFSYRFAAEQTQVIKEPLTVDHLSITFHDKLFDYFLSTPNMPLGYYITEIGGMKVGFGSKYMLKKFLQKMKAEFFTDGNIPGSNIKIAPIPEIEEPLVRRLGSVPVKVTEFTDEQKRKQERGAVNLPLWEISEGSENSTKVVNTLPSGPML